MKTPEQIANNISIIQDRLSELSKTRLDVSLNRKEIDSLVARRDYLKTIFLYLDGGVDQSIVEQRLKELLNRRQAIEDGFEPYMTHTATTVDSKKERAKYNRECNLKEINQQITTLQYILQ
jgi:hypothetical protein